MPRSLTSREIRLAVLLLTVVGVSGFIIFFKWYSAQIASQRAAIAATAASIAELDQWIAQSNIWQNRAEWLKDHRPPAYRAEDTKSACVEWTQNSTSAAGLSLSNLQLREEINSGVVTEVGISVVLTGMLEHLLRWMHRVHEKGAFREVREVKITSDADNSKVRAEVLLIFLCESPGASQESS